MNYRYTERSKSRIPCRAFPSKVTGAGTHTSTGSVNILLWVTNAVLISVYLLRIVEVLILGTLARLSQYMGTLNSVFSLDVSSAVIVKEKKNN